MEQEYWESLCISIGACVYLLSSMLQYLVLQKNSLIKIHPVLHKSMHWRWRRWAVPWWMWQNGFSEVPSSLNYLLWSYVWNTWHRVGGLKMLKPFLTEQSNLSGFFLLSSHETENNVCRVYLEKSLLLLSESQSRLKQHLLWYSINDLHRSSKIKWKYFIRKIGICIKTLTS